jgi:hypothetical protein
MMMDIATWNVLHDARLIAAEGAVPGDLRLEIDINYLCKLLPTASTLLVVEISSCTQFEYRSFDRRPLRDPHDIASVRLEILRAQLESETMSIECADGSYGGQLLVKYLNATLSTIEGAILSQKELETVADRYWNEWEQRARSRLQ